MPGPRHTEKSLVTVDVSFGETPRHDMVTPLCESLAELCRTVLPDEAAAARLRLTAHELLENIVKYSGDGACELRVELWRSADGSLRASVRTSNTPTMEHRHEAEQRFRALSEAADPLAHYDAVIADSAGKPAGSGLGLARIHAETEYRLSHRFEERRLVIVASGDVLPSEDGSR